MHPSPLSIMQCILSALALQSVQLLSMLVPLQLSFVFFCCITVPIPICVGLTRKLFHFLAAFSRAES